MWEDPIVAEVHRTREKLAAEHQFDVKAIFADLRQRQQALGERLVPQKRRAEPTAEDNRNGQSPVPADAAADAWDRKTADDVAAGRLDAPVEEAMTDLREGRCTDR